MTRLELGGGWEGAGAPAGVPKIAGDLLKTPAHQCCAPKAPTPDAVGTPQKAAPGPCRGASHPAPDQGNPPLLACPGWGGTPGEGGGDGVCDIQGLASSNGPQNLLSCAQPDLPWDFLFCVPFPGVRPWKVRCGRATSAPAPPASTQPSLQSRLRLKTVRMGLGSTGSVIGDS